jgi:hypothetical protein
MAMSDLLEGWADTEEEHSDVGGYQHRLLNAIEDMHFSIERLDSGFKTACVVDVSGACSRPLHCRALV